MKGGYWKRKLKPLLQLHAYTHNIRIYIVKSIHVCVCARKCVLYKADLNWVEVYTCVHACTVCATKKVTLDSQLCCSQCQPQQSCPLGLGVPTRCLHNVQALLGLLELYKICMPWPTCACNCWASLCHSSSQALHQTQVGATCVCTRMLMCTCI